MHTPPATLSMSGVLLFLSNKITDFTSRMDSFSMNGSFDSKTRSLLSVDAVGAVTIRLIGDASFFLRNDFTHYNCTIIWLLYKTRIDTVNLLVKLFDVFPKLVMVVNPFEQLSIDLPRFVPILLPFETSIFVVDGLYHYF